MAILQPVICLVEKKENSPFFRIFLQCLLDYRHIFETIFLLLSSMRVNVFKQLIKLINRKSDILLIELSYECNSSVSLLA